MPDFHLETERLIIRNWQITDRDLFYQINSDDRVMEYFTIRRTREQSNKMMDDLKQGISKNGYGFTAIALKQNNQPVGFCGLADASDEDPMFDGHFQIGWRLAPQFWGNGYATESARALLRFGFEKLNTNEILAFAVVGHNRSFAVMERIGMSHDPSRDFIHPQVPETHPHLRKHLTYSIKINEIK